MLKTFQRGIGWSDKSVSQIEIDVVLQPESERIIESPIFKIETEGTLRVRSWFNFQIMCDGKNLVNYFIFKMFLVNCITRFVFSLNL